MHNMDIESIKAQIVSESGKLDSLSALEDFKRRYLGRKGVLAGFTASISALPAEQRGEFGRQVNALKSRLSAIVEEKEGVFASCVKRIDAASCDITMPGIAQKSGHLHPLTQVTSRICSVFTRMGFSVVEGPEIETEYNNFTGLNIPLDHPSRDAFDTFYLKSPRSKTRSRLLLRSHTSPVQVRTMKERKPPLAVVVPGRVYRPDAADASHSFMFHQIEGFMVDKNLSFANLKGVLEAFAKAIFGREIRMRFRPHFFPFTEPSAEADISCIICQKAGGGERQEKSCSVCHGKGWLEILGAGMIHPNVFRQVGYDKKKYSGFAFGMGVERIAMLKYGINDIRLFFENDMRFLKQF